MAIKVQGITVIDDGRNIINGIGASFTGIVTATTFSGSGANLTSIPNSGLSNSSVNYGGVSLALGGSDATPAFNLSDATNYPTSSLSGTITNDQLAGSIADGKLASTFLKNVVEDTTPQLGGNLDINSKFITGTGGINVTGVITATTFSGSGTNLTGLTGASAATYGDASNVAQIVVDANGRITGISEVTISGGGGGGINGITIKEEGSVVGSSNSVQDINIVGDNLTATASGVGATITFTSTPTFTSAVVGSGVTINSDGANVTGVITATTFSGNLPTTDLTGTITNAQLDGSIANDKLVNSSVSYGGIELSLGGTDATPAFDLSDATAYPYTSLTGITTEILGDTTPQLGGNLDFNSKFITGTGGINVTGVVTTTKLHVGVDTGFYNEDLVVTGDTRITGILTIGTASITLDPNAKTLTGLDELQIGSGNTAITIKKNSTTGDITFEDISGKEASVGIGTTVSIKTTGIITATTFSGNLPTTDLTGTITNTQLAGSIANAKLANSSIAIGGVTLNLGDTDATPAFNLSDATDYPTSSLSGTITNAQLAGSITNAKLVNDSVSFGGVSLDLGGSDATPAFNLSDATDYPTSSLSGTITNAQLAGSIADDKLASTFLKNVVEDTTPQLGGNLDFNSKFITGTGGINVSGVITATTFDGSFSGNITGIASTATKLETSRNFSITGDFVTAPSISFDGTDNVSLGATIATNSIGLGTYTTGDYVESITGTGNQITVTSGTGEGSTPVISIPNNPTLPGTTVTIATDLKVNRNLNVTGNITIGGTTAFVDVERLRITDADIVLGYRTDSNNNDASNDTTASHGGIAIASTEGSPLISLIGAGETLPATYKKIMWFESGAFTGLATDAWITNYSFGVGTTSMSAGTKFAVGNIETDFDDITSVRHINSSGVITATTFSGNLPTTDLTGTITNAQLAGSIANAKLTNSSIAIGGVTLNLGDTDATPAFDLSDATAYPYTSLTGITTEIVGDTSPQLGGNLDLNSNNITGTGDFNVTGVITATTFSGSGANLTSIPNGALTNSSIAIGGVTLNLGDTDATPAFNLSDATDYPTSSLDGTITNAQLAGSIANDKLAGSIANDKLVNDSVSFGGVSTSLGSSVAQPAFDLTNATAYPTSSLDGTITNAQLAGSIANAKLANSSIAIGGVTLNLGDTDATPAFNLSDATDYPTSSLDGTITNAQLAGSIADAKLASTFLKNVVEDTTPQLGGNLDFNSKFITGTGGINVSGVITATTFSGNLPTTDLTGTITNTQLAGSIANAKLANSSIAIGGVTLNLGDTDATPAFDLSDATAYPYTSLTGITTEIVGDTTPQLGGNLDFNSKFITGTGGINVSGVITATSFIGSAANLTGLTGASAATYGDSSATPVIVVNSDGKITGISTVSISGGGEGSSGPDPVIMGMIF